MPEGKVGLPAHICERHQPSVIPAPLSVTKTHHDRSERPDRGMAAGQTHDEAQLHMASLQRLSTLVRNHIFTLWRHHGDPLEN